jgi:hypothetical protein
MKVPQWIRFWDRSPAETAPDPAPDPRPNVPHMPPAKRDSEEQATVETKQRELIDKAEEDDSDPPPGRYVNP